MTEAPLTRAGVPPTPARLAAAPFEDTGREPAVVLEELTVRLGHREILHGLSGALTGRAIGLLGPNGAGKTTLLHTLLGFVAPASGSARVLGLDVRTRRREILGQVGFMPERDAFVADMSGIRFVRMLAELSGLPADTALERAHEALNFVGLGEARYREIGGYSLGMRQLVKLAQALVHGPKLLFLDEPTNGLDPSGRERMLELIRDLNAAGNTTVVISSHLLRDVESACDAAVILRDGRLIAQHDLTEESRTDQGFVDLETVEPPEALADRLIRAGGTVAMAPGHRVKVVLPPGLGMRQVFQMAAETGVVIRQLRQRRDSLEDIFLKAMEDYDGSL